MLYMADFVFRMLATKLFCPVNNAAPRGILDPAPADHMAMRLHPETAAKLEELRQHVAELVRTAPMVRGKASRQALRLVGG